MPVDPANDGTAAPEKLPSKAIEIVGRNWLTARLVARGLAVATPEIDDGVDLLIFRTATSGVRALALQLKCATTKSFSLDVKYAGRGVVMAYVWDVLTEPSVYFLTYEEALDALGPKAAASASWITRGYYAINQIGPTVIAKLAPYRERWEWLSDKLEAT